LLGSRSDPSVALPGERWRAFGNPAYQGDGDAGGDGLYFCSNTRQVVVACAYSVPSGP
jgi:hypothetical protein